MFIALGSTQLAAKIWTRSKLVSLYSYVFGVDLPSYTIGSVDQQISYTSGITYTRPQLRQNYPHPLQVATPQWESWSKINFRLDRVRLCLNQLNYPTALAGVGANPNSISSGNGTNQDSTTYWALHSRSIDFGYDLIPQLSDAQATREGNWTLDKNTPTSLSGLAEVPSYLLQARLALGNTYSLMLTPNEVLNLSKVCRQLEPSTINITAGLNLAKQDR